MINVKKGLLSSIIILGIFLFPLSPVFSQPEEETPEGAVEQSAEEADEEAELRRIDPSEDPDCLGVGRSGHILKDMGFSPEQIRELRKKQFACMKKTRAEHIKANREKKHGLSKKIQDAYLRQKANEDRLQKAELEWIALFKEKSQEIKKITSSPDLANVPEPQEGMAYIPGGSFVMGVDWGDSPDNQPSRIVDLSPYFIDKLEVTVGAYKAFLKRKMGRVPPFLNDKDMGGDNQPAFKVSWKDAKGFCKKEGKRLPTEAEWEKAARGWDNRYFPWGNELPDEGGVYRANYDPGRRFEDGYRYSANVGTFAKGNSPYGLSDMTGNIWEWTADWYGPEYYKKNEIKDPKGPESGKKRVIRGGGHNTPVKRLLLTTRLKENPNMRRGYIGFRCAKSVE